MPAKSDHLYAASVESGHVVATVDVPACGFVLLRGDQRQESGAGFGGGLRQRLFGGPKPIAETAHLQNEFMEVALSAESGGISGVYSGSARGNRFSLRLVRAGLEGDATLMHCDSCALRSSITKQRIASKRRGTIRSEKGASDLVLATFRLRYTLRAGKPFFAG